VAQKHHVNYATVQHINNLLATKVVENHFQYGCRQREIVTLKAIF